MTCHHITCHQIIKVWSASIHGFDFLTSRTRQISSSSDTLLDHDYTFSKDEFITSQLIPRGRFAQHRNNPSKSSQLIPRVRSTHAFINVLSPTFQLLRGRCANPLRPFIRPFVPQVSYMGAELVVGFDASQWLSELRRNGN